MKKLIINTLFAAFAAVALCAGSVGCSGGKSKSPKPLGEQAIDFVYGLAHNDPKVDDFLAPDHYVSISGRQWDKDGEYWDGNTFPPETLSALAALPRESYQVTSAYGMMGRTEISVQASTEENAEYVRIVLYFGEGSKIVSCKGHMDGFSVDVYQHGR